MSTGTRYTALRTVDDGEDDKVEGPSMHRLTSHDSAASGKPVPLVQHATRSDSEGPPPSLQRTRTEEDYTNSSAPYTRASRLRYLGLAQLVLLNIIVSWDWLTFAAVSSTFATYFSVSDSSINWLSTGFLFAFCPVAPLVIWTLNKHGPKASILVSSTLVLAGNWIRYGGTRSNSFGVVIFGQVLIGFAQPFVLAAPTRYSNLWFSPAGRVSATAIASLANPFGAALGQLIGPFWASDDPSSIPRMVLYTSILSTVATLPAPFIPARPSASASSTSAHDLQQDDRSIWQYVRDVTKNGAFWLILLPFSIYTASFNATSSLLNQILEPYGFSETEAGIAGALLIVVGLVASAIVSPLVDRTKRYLLTVRVLVPFIAISYAALIFMPGTQTVPGPYVVLAVLGATSFSLLPCALEYLVLVTYPVSPEVSSTVCWTGGQLLGGVWIVIMNALRTDDWDDEPNASMITGLIFQAVIAVLVVPCVFVLGRGRFKGSQEGLQMVYG
ncbi:hypothetical protein D0864_03292 [Hortaea werneckii]|uniref:Major facilitator superfamily (MFS) profile domain-containing protein n=1 Tax=Hortaea werneckii TaxID=91943 RepID=A0A3M7GMZ7_HORWE|nr:MFS general substrate transporter [Hortaea werneckii]KAI6874401.1 MFS general substrate transporter [Hortaea werneckii]RMZ02105.1 hypothetical protein D0864_03292 [Hortaea werneckii]